MEIKRGKRGISEKYESFLSYDEAPREVTIQDFSGGVCLGEAGSHVISHMMNMQPAGKRLCSVSAAKEEFFPAGAAEGTVRHHCFADGVWLFRKGRTIYARVGDTLSLVGTENMLEKDFGAIYDLGGKFYLIDGMDIYVIEHDLSYRILTQAVPVCYTNVSSDGKVKTVQEQPRIFQPYIDLQLSDEGRDRQTLPQDIACHRLYLRIFYPNSDLWMSPMQYTFDGTTIVCKENIAGHRVRLELVESEDPEKLSLNTCALSRAFWTSPNPMLPYTDGDGNDYLLTWREKEIRLVRKTGNLFYDFSEGDIKRFPMGETVTAVIPYEEGYFVFAEDTVKKLRFEKNAVGALSAVTEIFKRDFGSDMPGSVCGFDDKILFASSRGGIFYINKFGLMERDVSRKISANIENGEEGFFSHTAEEYQNARGVCAFGKYWLTVGDITYIWDYNEKLPSGTQNLREEQSMVWTLSDRLPGAHFLQELWGRLYFWDDVTQSLRYLSGRSGEEVTGDFSFVTAETDLGTMRQKVLTEVGIRYRAKGTVMLRLILDGEALPAQYMLPAHDGFTTEYLHPYTKRFETIAVSVLAEEAMAVETILIRYIE